MAREFTKLWGPSQRKTTRSEMRWTFYAIWQSGAGQRYHLVFSAEKRRWTTRRVTTKDDGRKAAAYADAMSLGDGAAEITGRTITDILRARLSADDIARATALGMQWRRT